MKKLIPMMGALVALPFYSNAMSSLKDLVYRNITQRILNYPILTPEQKELFNHSAQPTAEILDLRRLNYDYLDLSGIKIYEANFQGVHFKGTNFYKADLRGCNFKGATFNYVNLKEANLAGTEFKDCHFKDTELQGAILTEKQTAEGEFIPSLRLPYYFKTIEILQLYSDLQNQEERQKDKEVLNQFIGTGVFDFSGQWAQNLNLRNIDFKNCDLSDINLTGPDLTDAQFENTILGKAIFSFAKLSETLTLKDNTGPIELIKLYAEPNTTQDQKNILNKILGSQINLSYEVLDELNLKGINLMGADLKMTSFKNCNLIDANLNNANLAGVKFQGASFIEEAKIPPYTHHKDLVESYSKSTDQKEKDNLNKLFDISPLQLQDADLRGLDLTGINLHKADLTNVQLQNTQLFDGFEVPHYNTPTDLINIYAQSKDQKEKDNLNKLFDIFPLQLQKADLKGLDLTGINLHKADLKLSNLNNTNLTNAILPEIKPNYTYLSGATLPDGTQAPYYDSSHDLLQRYSDSKDQIEKQNLNKLSETISYFIVHKYLHSLNLSGISLKNSYITISDLQKVNFEGANLTKTKFHKTNFRNTDFTNANLTQTIFENCELQGAIFFDGFKVPDYETDTDLVKYYAKSNNPKERQALNKLFDHIPLNLEGAELKNLDLQGINLTQATLENTDFTGSNLTNIILNYTYSLKPANLNETQWGQDFKLPANISKETMKEFYQKMNKTDQNMYLFLKTSNIKNYYY